MGPADIYKTSRERLLTLAPQLDEEHRAAPLGPTPPWTVVDGYRHLTGVCCDVLDGTMPGHEPGAGEAWTAAQIEQRRGWSLEQVTAQWAERAPELDARVREAGPAMGFVALDSWTHEQDIRAASGAGAFHDDELLPGLIALTVGAMDRFYAGNDGPPLRLVLDGDEHRTGDGEPEAELTTSRYELLRMVFGRRSQAQIGAAGWSGGGAARAQRAITLFPAQTRDLVD